MGEEQPLHDQWRVRVPTGELGPVNLDTLRTWIREDRVKPDDLIGRLLESVPVDDNETSGGKLPELFRSAGPGTP